MSSINTNINTNKTLETGSNIGTSSGVSISITKAIQTKTTGNSPEQTSGFSESIYYVDPIDSMATMMFNSAVYNITIGHGAATTGRTDDRRKLDITTGDTENTAGTPYLGKYAYVIGYDPSNLTGGDKGNFLALSNQKTQMLISQNNVLTIFDPDGKFTIPYSAPLTDFDKSLIVQINDKLCKIPYKKV